MLLFLLADILFWMERSWWSIMLHYIWSAVQGLWDRWMDHCSCNAALIAIKFRFYPLHGMQTRSSDENSICMSVCLWNAWFVTKWKKDCSRFLLLLLLLAMN